jgi:hypothetical protein
MAHSRNALEKFLRAADGMAIADGRLRNRIRDAFTSLNVLHEYDLPDALRADFRRLMTRLTWAEPIGNGRLTTSLAAMSDEEVQESAKLIVEIAQRLTHAAVGASRKDGPRG